MICLLEFSPDFWPNRQRSFKRLAARWHSPAALDLEGEIDALYNDPCQLALRLPCAKIIHSDMPEKYKRSRLRRR